MTGSNPTPLVLTNRQRMLVPLISLVVAAFMFWPVLAMVGLDPAVDPVRYGLGLSMFMIVFAWLGVSTIRVPFRLTLDTSGGTLQSLIRTRTFRREEVRQWTFLHPDGPPSQQPPAVNGLILVKLRGASFRAEVNHDEAEAARVFLRA